MGIPDFCIVGAPKCGTTALYEYLSTHPSICMSARKEPNYFCSDLNTGAVDDPARYKALYSHAAPAQLTGEATSLYLFSSVAIARIMEVNPEAKIIVMLRNPVNAAPAFHRQRLINLQEDVQQFENAWRMQDDRLLGEHVPRFCREPALLQYRSLFSYAPQIARLLNRTRESQRHFIIFEEFFSDPDTHYAKVLDFLGVEQDGRRKFPKVNQAARLRSRRFAQFYLYPPDSIRSVWNACRRASGLIDFHPGSILQRLNRTRPKDAGIDPNLRAELAAYFAADINSTELLLGRTLDIWRSERR